MLGPVRSSIQTESDINADVGGTDLLSDKNLINLKVGM